MFITPKGATCGPTDGPVLNEASARRTAPGSGAIEWDLMVRTLLCIWAAAGVLFVGIIALTDLSPGRRATLSGLAALIVVVFAILVLDRHRLPWWTPDVCAVLLYGLVGLVLTAYDNPASPAALAYLWLAVHSFYFLPWRRAAPQVAFVAASYAASLMVIAEAFPLDRWLLTVLTVAAVSTMVALLRLRVAGLLAGLADMARTDPLTGLANRRAYNDIVDYELARTERTGDSLALVLGDLDHFKQINDRYGHQRGDEVLVRVAKVLAHSERRIDVAVRLGGEEFALVLPNTDVAGAHLVAERVRLALASEFFADPMVVTMSLGVAVAPDDAATAPALFQAADAALMEAKRTGRDRTVVYDGRLRSAL